MPYGKRKYNKSRKYNNRKGSKNYRRKRNYKRKYIKSYSPFNSIKTLSSQMPKFIKMKFKYDFYAQRSCIAGNAGYVLNLNSLFDPDYTSIGH